MSADRNAGSGSWHRCTTPRWLLAVPALLLAVLATPVGARPLEAIESRGILSMCAHPNAMPYSRKSGEPRGFAIDIGEALAGELGVRLSVEWVVTRYQPRRARCDLLVNSINDRQAQGDSGVRLSKPYRAAGVALAVRRDDAAVGGFDQIPPGVKVGVLSNSMASMVLGQRGVRISVFGFEDDMMDALAAGEIGVAAVSPAAAGYYNHQHGGDAVRIARAYVAEPRLRWTVAVGMREADRPLAKAIDAALQALMANGTLQSIFARYGIDYREPPSKIRGEYKW